MSCGGCNREGDIETFVMTYQLRLICLQKEFPPKTFCSTKLKLDLWQYIQIDMTTWENRKLLETENYKISQCLCNAF